MAKKQKVLGVISESPPTRSAATGKRIRIGAMRVKLSQNYYVLINADETLTDERKAELVKTLPKDSKKISEKPQAKQTLEQEVSAIVDADESEGES